MNSEEFKVASVKPPISFAELEKIDIRVGTIAAVEEVAGSDKLVRSSILAITSEISWPESNRSATARNQSRANKHCLS
jgi:hypothetical protein